MAPTRSIGRSLELFYVDGTAEGLVTAKTFGWIGQVLLVPRTRMAEGLRRPEAACAGVYFLLGERNGAPLAYIGESEAVGKRLLDHDSKKDWWTEVICVTAADLNKAHVKYLEARLVEEARAVGAMPLDNSQTPLRNSLSEADQGKMEAFLQTLMMVLPAVRLDMFVRRTRPAVLPTAPVQAVAGAEARFYLRSPKHGLTAEAVLIDGDFVVQAGSQARASWEAAQEEAGYAKLFAELWRSGMITPDGDKAVFAASCAFRSPSAAAAVILGHAANGATYWKTVEGRTYKEWEQQRLAGVG